MDKLKAQGPLALGSIPRVSRSGPQSHQARAGHADGSGTMFDAIARRYDALNRILSLGLDQGWRRRTVRALGLAAGDRVLDLATGTADLALMIVRLQPDSTVVAVDPSPGMLAVARRKIEAAGQTGSIGLELGDAQDLPFAAASFDAVSMSFGIRNVRHRPRALAEIARVTRPGGKVAILELSEPSRGPLALLTRFHVHWLVPRVGAALSGAPQYRYLQQSIAAFPSPPAFAQLMEGSGLSVESVRSLSFGVCHLYLASKSAEKGRTS